MSEHSFILRPNKSICLGKAHSFISEDEDDVSSLQALINILRKPHEVTCCECWGNGAMLNGKRCGPCNGTGKRLSSRVDY